VKPTTGAINDLTRTAQERLGRLIWLAAPLALPLSPKDRRLISYVVIEAANLWAQYSQCLFLSCALGAKDVSGQRIVVNRAPTMNDALTLAVHATKPKMRGTYRQWQRRDLPDFQQKSELGKTVRYVRASVAADVDLALGYQSRVLEDLPTMRNFFAHKAELAATKARNLAPRYGLSRALSPETLLCTPPRGGADVVLREWIADLNAILTLMP